MLISVESVKSKIEEGKYISLKEKREFIKWCISRGLDNRQIMEKFNKYEIKSSQFLYDINSMRDLIP